MGSLEQYRNLLVDIEEQLENLAKQTETVSAMKATIEETISLLEREQEDPED